MNVKKNATAPYPRAYLEAPPGTPLDLSDAASVTFQMVHAETGATKASGAATVENAAAGLVSYAWQAGDTDTVGLYRAEWTVTLASGLVWKIPSAGALFVNVLPSP